MGQTILITGANRGIGLALTKELLNGGHRVLGTARNPGKATELEKLRKEHGAALEIIAMDADSDGSVRAAAATAGAMTKAIDVLVNNAAIFPEDGTESIFDMKLEHFREAFETNVLGIIRVTREFLALVEKAENPRIVNVSSEAGSVRAKENDYGYYAYSASKAALNMVTRALAAEFRPRGVCIVAMSPGWVKTDMGGPNAQIEPEDSARSIAKTITTLTMAKSSHFIDRNSEEIDVGW